MIFIVEKIIQINKNAQSLRNINRPENLKIFWKMINWSTSLIIKGKK